MAATVTLSIEVELAWGRHDLPGGGRQVLDPERTAETSALQRLLATCDRLDLPISFDVVGHLLHESCDGTHDSPHEPGWFDADPGSDVGTDPLFYAPDLVERIDDATTDHEICTHTYSHALCDEISKETLEWEFERVETLHAAAGVTPPKSFVAPRHRAVPHDVLRRHGIEVLRRPFAEREHRDDGLIGFVGQYRRTHPLVDARPVDGLVETYCASRPTLTAPFLKNGRRRPPTEHRVLPRRLRQRLHRRFLHGCLDAVEDTESQLHLWTHLYNLANDAQWPPVRAFLETLAGRREEGTLEVRRIADLAALADGCPTVQRT